VPFACQTRTYFTDQELTIDGMGQIGEGDNDYAHILQEAKVSGVADDKCTHPITKSMICTSGLKTSTSTCSGDSGGA
jgi:hypothetical protein